MLKKTITYEDYNGATRTGDFYFNLGKMELIKMSMELPKEIRADVPEDPEKVDDQRLAEKLVETLGEVGTFEFIEKIVLKAYGVRHADGSRFEKSPELTAAFAQSPAFDALMIEFITNTDAAMEFVQAVIPAGVNAKTPAIAANN